MSKLQSVYKEQIAILHHLGIRVVLVHGGGPQLDEMLRSLGIEPRMGFFVIKNG